MGTCKLQIHAQSHTTSKSCKKVYQWWDWEKAGGWVWVGVAVLQKLAFTSACLGSCWKLKWIIFPHSFSNGQSC